MACVKRYFRVRFRQTAELVERVRKSLGPDMTQEKFAPMMNVTKGSIQNWETGSKRPSPKHLQTLARLAPQFQREIEALLATFEWHPKRAGAVREEVIGLSELLEEGDWLAVQTLAKKERKPIAKVCAELIESGLQARIAELAEKTGSAGRRRRSKAS